MIKTIKKILLTAILSATILSTAKATETINPQTNLRSFFGTTTSTTVLAESGRYEHDGITERIKLYGIILKPVEKKNIWNYLDLNNSSNLMLNNSSNLTLNDFPVFENGMYLMDKTSIEDVIFDGENISQPPLVTVYGNNTLLKNCLIKNAFKHGVLIYSKADNSIISNNIIVNSGKYGVNFSNADPNVKRNIIVRENYIAFNKEAGIYCDSYINIGDEFYRGDNILRNNLNIFLGRVVVVPAEWNYWYKENGMLITTEKEILDSCRLPLTRGNSPLDVVPFYGQHHPLFEVLEIPKSNIKDWRLYN